MNGWRGGSGALTGCGVAGVPTNAGVEPLSLGIGMAATASTVASALRMWRIFWRSVLWCAPP